MKNMEEIITNIIKVLAPRQQEIIMGRFGLGKFKRQNTLAAIGAKYDITRERVRQIESASLATLASAIASSPESQLVLKAGKARLEEAGGILEKREFFAKPLPITGVSDRHLGLLLASSKAFSFRDEDEEYHPFYYVNDGAFKNMQNVVSQWADTLQKRKDTVLAGAYNTEFEKFVKAKNLNAEFVKNYLAVSKGLHANPYGDMGLAEWPEIRPQTIRDRIYLILKKNGNPLHFETIAKEINKVGFDSRKALPATVHNELIKDIRFILVGRGMYGLSEHGYEAGTAREVIHRILKVRGPMKPRDVILAVQKERFLKPNTVLVNLQNKSFFRRLNDGTYHVREA
jgi:hypothetical protein